MAINIYNTLTRSKEEFIPLTPKKVNIYVCGPTVYSHSHIGHAKSYISFDVVVRYLKYKKFSVTYVQNITDVGHLTDDADSGDDKIIKKAKEEKINPMEVAEFYTWSYFDDMDKLGISRANVYPRASGHIIEQIEMVKILLEKGYAYEVNGNVYFDITKSKDYGKLSGRNVEELEAGARIEINEEKKNPADFALWKRAEAGHLMRWPSPWGEGYPGWHIECSAMSMKYLGETFDIHGGGLDNIFPHHECEIAQSEAVTGKPFARYWMHNNMVTVNGSKMSKSLNNSITIKEALERYNASTIRFFVLSSHYRSKLDVSDKALNAARTGAERLLSTVYNLNKTLFDLKEAGKGEIPFQVEEFRKKFESVMDDDFNTPQAIAVLFDLARETNSYLNSGKDLNKQFLESLYNLFIELAGNVLGLLSEKDITEVKKASEDSAEKVIQVLITIRDRLRNEKQYKLADEIRAELSSLGIQLSDKPDKTSFNIKSGG